MTVAEKSAAAAVSPTLASFDRLARDAATAKVFPFVATYFADAETWEFRPEVAASQEHASDSQLARAIRLRVLLAQAVELEEIALSVLQRPTFAYRQMQRDSVGEVRGRLDVNRYVRGRGRRNVPRVYPVTVVERHTATPENLLLADALRTLERALATAGVGLSLPARGPERRYLEVARGTLIRLERFPIISSLGRQLDQSSRIGRLNRLRLETNKRLRRGDIASPWPYRRLSGWVERFREGVGHSSGRLPWLLYDERFDTRLFEIWALAGVIGCLTSVLGRGPDGDGIRPLWDRNNGAIASWTTPLGQVLVHFQREAASVGLAGRWSIPRTEHVLRGIPDVVIEVAPVGRPRDWLLVDCKLRRHAPLPVDATTQKLDLPVEEIYKMLGYFEQFRWERGFGALVYYTPGGNGSLEMISQRARWNSSLDLFGVDPLLADPARVLGGVAHRVQALLGGPSKGAQVAAKASAAQAAAAGEDQVEQEAASKQTLLKAVLETNAKARSDELPAIEKLTRSWFPAATWDGLEQDSRRMVLSAELYGSQTTEGLDHSGPLLVLCAACERELNTRTFERVRERFPADLDDQGSHVLDDHPTLGAAIQILDRGRRIAVAVNNGDKERVGQLIKGAYTPSQGRAVVLIGKWIIEAGVDLSQVKACLKKLRKLNEGFRRPAAHDRIVEAEEWSDGRALILGDEKVLDALVKTFPHAV